MSYYRENSQNYPDQKQSSSSAKSDAKARKTYTVEENINSISYHLRCLVDEIKIIRQFMETR